MNETFATRLSSLRKQSKMTQNEVAEKLGVTFQAVSLWERGETTPEVNKISDLAVLFHVTTDWLITGEKEKTVHFDEIEAISDRFFNEDRMYTYIKTYATVKGLYQTLKVLPYARELHKGQYRKGKDQVPYIYHPLLVACHALSLGLNNDDLIATALLHDVCEDCGVLPEELPVSEEIKIAVGLLTKTYLKSPEQYYREIATNKMAIMVKLLDRCNNVSGMAAGFCDEKIISYIKQTEKWIYPLFDIARTQYPEYSNQIFLIKYHMISVINSFKRRI